MSGQMPDQAVLDLTSTVAAEQMPRATSTWLAVREAADAAARATELVALAGARARSRRSSRPLRESSHLVIHDLGCGTGSMGRWLAPQLTGTQHWIMHDRDPDLLEQAAIDMVDKAADGESVTAETRLGDITRLTADAFAGASLVTASALLDLLTTAEIEGIAAAIAGAGCPALLTLSVIGRVRLTPTDPLDAQIGAAFNAHQRRKVGRRILSGPDAFGVAVDAFNRHGAQTVIRSSPWLLGSGDTDLVSQWFDGWVEAGCEHQLDLAGPAHEYVKRRLAQVAEGRLDVVVEHSDLLVQWQ